MDKYVPEYSITPKMLDLSIEITKKLEEIKYYSNLSKEPHLRRENRMKSIYSSLAIEGNTLSLDEVRDVINGVKVIGPEKDIQEVKNIVVAYNNIGKYNPYLIEDLKKAQGYITNKILDESGNFRSRSVGVFSGNTCIHLAPPYENVLFLMEGLFNWMKEKREELNPLILSSIFHYEFVFIHPFSDGNGRTARLWQTVLLSKWNDFFEYLPIENQIKENQTTYYEVINKCNMEGNSNSFIEYMLQIINDAIDKQIKQEENIKKKGKKLMPEERKDKIIKLMLEDKYITSNDLKNKLNVSIATIERDLLALREEGIIEYKGSKKTGYWEVYLDKRK